MISMRYSIYVSILFNLTHLSSKRQFIHMWIYVLEVAVSNKNMPKTPCCHHNIDFVLFRIHFKAEMFIVYVINNAINYKDLDDPK